MTSDQRTHPAPSSGQPITLEQVDGLTDLDPEALRVALHAAVEVVVEHLTGLPDRAVFPAVEPGSLVGLFPSEAPEHPEPLEAILADHQALVEPNATQWQHPGLHGLFPDVGLGRRDRR